MKYGCIGEHLTHSFSKEIHSLIADYDYEIREIERDSLEGFIRRRDFLGINVTIPYKEAVIPYLDDIDANARDIGAVNTVVKRDGRLCGYNTDFLGMRALILHANIDVMGKKVLILGTGGTAKTATAVVRSLGVGSLVKVSRAPKAADECDYETAIKKHCDAEIIINTTPVGMYPNIAKTPIDISNFEKLSGVIDMIYNPLRTTLVIEARERGLRAEGGLYMLVAQAVYASEIFLDKKYGEGLIERIYERILAEKENAVLIGMPGSGKSTVGEIVARELSRELVDTDEEIKRVIGKSADEIIREYGEESFRDAECDVIANISAKNSSVIATGGGAVLRRENVRNLKKNGRIYFLDRDIDLIIPTKNRPLTATREDLIRKFEERLPIYKSVCDVIIDNNLSREESARKIASAHLIKGDTEK